jgi:hypothetical protein
MEIISEVPDEKPMKIRIVGNGISRMQLQLAIAELNLGQQVLIVDDEVELSSVMKEQLEFVIRPYDNDCDPRPFFTETKDWVQDTKKTGNIKEKEINDNLN